MSKLNELANTLQSVVYELRKMDAPEPPPNKWRNVYAMLPGDGIRVLAIMQTGLFCVCYWYDGHWWMDANGAKDTDYCYVVTHWTPLPQKPQINI